MYGHRLSRGNYLNSTWTSKHDGSIIVNKAGAADSLDALEKALFTQLQHLARWPLLFSFRPQISDVSTKGFVVVQQSAGRCTELTGGYQGRDLLREAAEALSTFLKVLSSPLPSPLDTVALVALFDAHIDCSVWNLTFLCQVARNIVCLIGKWRYVSPLSKASSRTAITSWYVFPLVVVCGFVCAVL